MTTPQRVYCIVAAVIGIANLAVVALAVMGRKVKA